MTRASGSRSRIAATVAALLVVIAGLALGAAPASAATCTQPETDIEVGETGTAAQCAGGNVHITITERPAKGFVSVFGQDGGLASVLYDPIATGQDTFKFRWEDGASSGEETITTNNLPEVNDPPHCFDQHLGVGVGDPAAVFEPCFDNNDDSLHISITEAPAKGTATVVGQDTPEATVQYEATDTGWESFKYKASDGALESTEATVTTNNLAAGDDTPLCADLSDGNFDVGDPATLAAGCFDLEHQDIDINITLAPARGTVELVDPNDENTLDDPVLPRHRFEGHGVLIHYKATALGTDIFQFTASDGNSVSDPITVTTSNVPAEDDPPICRPRQLASTFEGVFEFAFVIGAPAEAFRCLDVERDDIHIDVAQAPAKGTLTVVGQDTPQASLCYAATLPGADGFKFTASDGSSGSPEAPVVTVNTAPGGDGDGPEDPCGGPAPGDGDDDPPPGDEVPPPGDEDAIPCPEGTSPTVVCATDERGRTQLTGTEAGETIVGTKSDDVVKAGAGKDKVKGKGGHDKLSGQGGKDKLKGGSGNDQLRGGSGKDNLKGQGGKDKIKGQGGKDSFSGGGANDTIDSKGQRREKVNCGGGRKDKVKGAKGDKVNRNCERVRR